MHPLPGPITVTSKGVCTFPNLKPTHQCNSPEQQEQGNVDKPALYRPCSVRCRQLSTRDVQIIRGLKDRFDEDIQVLRDGFDKVDSCPYEHSKKQECKSQIFLSVNICLNRDRATPSSVI